MPTDLAARNRANATHSTGPRTAAGKAAAGRNSLRHGLLSESPIATTCEHEADWQRHLAATCRTLSPAGHLETVLAERVALLHWRLARVARYESAHIDSDQLDLQTRDAEKRFTLPSGRPSTRSDLQVARERAAERHLLLDDWQHLDDETPLEAAAAHTLLAACLAVLGPQSAILPSLPDRRDGETLAPYCRRHAWTAGSLRALLDQVAASTPYTAAELATGACNTACDEVLDLATARSDEELALQQRCHTLPDLAALDRLARYEAHLSRELGRAMRELERLQAVRIAQPPVQRHIADLPADSLSHPCSAMDAYPPVQDTDALPDPCSALAASSPDPAAAGQGGFAAPATVHVQNQAAVYALAPASGERGPLSPPRRASAAIQPRPATLPGSDAGTGST